ncbi:MAG: NAD(P)H-dependent oxidoreductase [Eubacteriales bacterium]|nr:NAD(P)H-dependent oxidoreductase [Eubacteriales bacterium]
MNVLYINACVRDESRTDRLARRLLEKFGSYREVRLDSEQQQPLDNQSLTERTRQIAAHDYVSHRFDYAKEFHDADIIVIAAPFWDLSFPSLLKIYIENIYVTGIVSEYGADGIPRGLCNAEKLYYVTTAGGVYDPKYSYEYIKDMAQNYFGIKKVELIKAEMLDVAGYDPQSILEKACEEIDGLFK